MYDVIKALEALYVLSSKVTNIINFPQQKYISNSAGVISVFDILSNRVRVVSLPKYIKGRNINISE